MKKFEQFDTINEKEKLFLQLAHLDKLEIVFDFIKYEDDLFYFYKKTFLFDQYKKNKYFYINYDKIWSNIEKKFALNYNEISEFMEGMVEKHFKLNDYTTNDTFNLWFREVEKHFKLNDYTTIGATRRLIMR